MARRRVQQLLLLMLMIEVVGRSEWQRLEVDRRKEAPALPWVVVARTKAHYHHHHQHSREVEHHSRLRMTSAAAAGCALVAGVVNCSTSVAGVARVHCHEKEEATKLAGVAVHSSEVEHPGAGEAGWGR